MAEEPRTTTPAPRTTPTPDQQATDDQIMTIRKMAGSIAEVIEPVQRTVMQRTDR